MNARPWVANVHIDTFPYFCLAEVSIFTKTFPLSSADYIDAYNPVARTWEMEQLSIAREIQSGERRLFRIRPDFRESLDDSQCPGLDHELKLQESFWIRTYHSEIPKPIKRPLDEIENLPASKHPRPESSQSDESTPVSHVRAANQSEPLASQLFADSTGGTSGISESSFPSPFTSSPEFNTTSLAVAESPGGTQHTQEYPYGPDTPGSVAQSPSDVRISISTVSDSELSFAFADTPVSTPQPIRTPSSLSQPFHLHRPFPPQPAHTPQPQLTPSTQPVQLPTPQLSQPPLPIPREPLSRETPAPPRNIPAPPRAISATPSVPSFLLDDASQKSEAGTAPAAASAKAKPWPFGKTLLEVDAGFTQMKELMERQPGLKQPAAFTRVFGVEYKKSTVHNHHRAWREHRALVAEWAARASADDASWSEFMRAVAALEKNRRDARGAGAGAGVGVGVGAGVGVADGEAAAAAFGNVQAFGSPRGGVMMSIAMPHQGIGAAMGMQSSLARSVHMQQEGAGAMRPGAPLGGEQAPYLGE